MLIKGVFVRGEEYQGRRFYLTLHDLDAGGELRLSSETPVECPAYVPFVLEAEVTPRQFERSQVLRLDRVLEVRPIAALIEGAAGGGAASVPIPGKEVQDDA